MKKTNYVIAWVIIVILCLWVSTHYQSAVATILTVAFVGGPALLITSMCGLEKKEEEDQ